MRPNLPPAAVLSLFPLLLLFPGSSRLEPGQGLLTAAWADADDEEEEEALLLPPELCFEYLANDQEQTAYEELDRLSQSEVVRAARRALKSSEEVKVLVGAAIYLGSPQMQERFKDVDWAKPLKLRLDQELPVAVRAAVLEALAALGDGDALEELGVQVMRAQTREEVRNVARGLCRSEDGLRRLLFLAELMLGLADDEEAAAVEGEDQEEQEFESEAEGEEELGLDPPEGEREKPPATRERLDIVFGALRRTGSTKRGVTLVRLIASGHPESGEILELLTEIRQAEARGELRLFARQNLDANDPERRALAIRLVVSTLDREYQQEILRALEPEGPEAVLVAATHAAWRLGLREAIPRLLPLLDSAARPVQLAAYEVLQRFSKKRLPLRRGLWEQWWLALEEETDEDEDSFDED